jgi:hypothetical protein
MAGMVARHGELASYANGHFELAVPESHRMYAEKAYQDKLKAELQQHFGPTLRLTVKVGNTAGTSVAAARSREAAQKQAVARRGHRGRSRSCAISCAISARRSCPPPFVRPTIRRIHQREEVRR